jgi:hypothetical protein
MDTLKQSMQLKLKNQENMKPLTAKAYDKELIN